MKYYKPDEVATMLSVNKAKVWKLITSGALIATNVGTDKLAYYRISQENLDSFLRNRTQKYGEQRHTKDN